ncbi:MAG: efflux RND transporter periplasmic adaptor subunit [Herminiimonas sp.]|nr:efflux RND transporter periplasmic adaptor subunit [Herminiimonas sp.]
MKNDLIETELAAAEPAGDTRSTRRRWIIIGAVVAIAAAGGGWALTHKPAKKEDPDAPKKAEVMELSPSDSVLIASRELQVALPVSGSLMALNQATVKSKVAGEVIETPLAEGMRVARGQIVVRLDTADLRARMNTQQATLDDARARLALARKNQESNLTLLKQKFISQNAVDTAQNSVEVAEATQKSAAAQLDIARRAVDDAVVRAPIDGIISKRFVQPGEKAAPDMPLFAIVNLQRLILEAQVPASEIPKVAIGQKVDFTVEGFAGRPFAGRVVRINPAAEAGSRAITVYVAVDNADGALRSGMFAKGGITLQTAAPLPLLPLAALRQQNGKPMVLKVEDGKVVAQPVRLGLRNDDEGFVQVEKGLAAGDRVIVARLDNVKSGSRVRLPGTAATATPSAPAAAPVPDPATAPATTPVAAPAAKG